MRNPLRTGWSLLGGLGQGIFAVRKWILAYVVIILIPTSALLVSYYQRSSRILEEEVTRTMQQTIRQAGLNLTYKLKHISDISNSVFMNGILYDNLVKEDRTMGQVDQLKELRNLAALAQESGEIHRMRIFVDRSKLYAGEGVNLFDMLLLDKYPWHQAVIEAGGSMVWTGVYREDFSETGVKEVFSVARVLRNPVQFEEVIGVLVFDAPARLMEEVMSDLELSAKYPPVLVDAEGRVVYASPSAGSAAADSLPGDLPGISLAGLPDEGILQMTDDREEIYVIYTTVGTTGWKLVARVSQSEISHRAAAQNQFSSVATLAGITVLFLLLVFVLLTFTVQSMQRRAQTIIRLIRKEGIGWLEERKPLPDGDFLLLERSVDHLIHKVNSLMEESYRAKVQEREAQLRALQAQINPHFLYNALDMINWSAIAHDAEDTSQMIEALARYFRLSLSSGRDNVSIADELELARVYLEIQMSRFPSTFTFHIEAEPGLESYTVPKLTLQPIVENALLHGIRKKKAHKGTLRIIARRSEDDVLLTVSDDGIGMEEELAGRLLVEPRPDKREDGSGSSYGLYNVHERIRFFAGDDYGITIATAPGAGTAVTVRLRAIPMEEAG